MSLVEACHPMGPRPACTGDFWLKSVLLKLEWKETPSMEGLDDFMVILISLGLSGS